MNTHRQLGMNQMSGARSLEKLSSGLRINRAGDDAAGLAISEKMRGQIRGLNQAGRNAQDAISMVQTAEGAASSVHSMLQRGRELAVQAANGTLTAEDRSTLNGELAQLKDQINDVSESTEFNTIKLMNTSSISSEYQDLAATIKDRLEHWIGDSISAISEHLGLSVAYTGKTMNVEFFEDSSPTAAGATMGATIGGNNLTLSINLSKIQPAADAFSSDFGWGPVDGLIAHEIVHAFQFTEMDHMYTGEIDHWFVEGMAVAIQGGNPFLQQTLANGGSASLSSGSFDGDYGSAFAGALVLHDITDGGLNAIINELVDGKTLNQAIANTTQTVTGSSFNVGDGVVDFQNKDEFISWFNSSGAVSTFLDNFTGQDNIGSLGNNQGEVRDIARNDFAEVIGSSGTNTENRDVFNLVFSTDSPDSTLTSFTLHVGANQGQTITMDAVDISSAGLNITATNISTVNSANDAIAQFDQAIAKVSGFRSTYGALQNRLEYTINNLTLSSENLQAAESRIRDVDMAAEMMEFTKTNILQQAATAMLAQANQAPQSVLQLLG